MKSIRTTVSLAHAQHKLLQEIAESNGLSVSWVIRQAVTKFLEQHTTQEFSPITPSKLDDTNSGDKK